MKTPYLSKIARIVSIVALCFIFGTTPAAADQSSPAAPETQHGDTAEFIAYYFYTSQRCASCYRLEQWSENAIKEHFKQAIEGGELQWKTVNVEKPENAHFTKDFNLYTKSLIIVEQKDGKVSRWKNLDKVWQLLRDKEKYFEYVGDEIHSFMEKS